MIVNYFKKSKMYDTLKNLLPDVEFDSIRDFSYKFYRGSEWLKGCSSDGDYYYNLYHCGYLISLDIYIYDYDSDKYEQIDRMTFRFVSDSGEFVKTYQRSCI